MDDLVKRNKQRLAQKEAVRQYREELQDQKSKRQVKPAYYQGYNADVGKYEIQTLGDSTTTANRIITNGAIPTGSSVNFVNGFLDATPRVKPTVKSSSIVDSKNIKYVLRKTVSGVTSLYVCGWKSQCQKVLDLPVGASLRQVSIDNLGGNNYYVSLFYTQGSSIIFQLYSQSGLVNSYSESGLGAYTELVGITSINGVPFIDQYWDEYIYCVGFGRFICNYGGDNNTIINNVTGTNPATGNASGRIRFIVDLLSNTEVLIQKHTHSTENYIRTLTPGPGSTTIITSDYQWTGLEVFASASNTTSSSLTSNTIGGALPIITYNTNTRIVYKVSKEGDIGFGELLYANTSDPNEGYYLYVNTQTDERSYLIVNTQGGGGVNTNRFIASLSQFSQSGDNLVRHCDITRLGFNFIEKQIADPDVDPPIPSTTLYQIERKTTPQQVTVQKLNFEFEKSSSVNVKVYQPDINASETSNFGTVLAASYG